MKAKYTKRVVLEKNLQNFLGVRSEEAITKKPEAPPAEANWKFLDQKGA